MAPGGKCLLFPQPESPTNRCEIYMNILSTYLKPLRGDSELLRFLAIPLHPIASALKISLASLKGRLAHG